MYQKIEELKSLVLYLINKNKNNTKETKDYVNNEVEHINATVNNLTLSTQKNEISRNKHKTDRGEDTKTKTTKSAEQNPNLNPNCIQPVEQNLTSNKTPWCFSTINIETKL